ncbi:MAG TPA: aminotransferase class IV [Acidimicrobiales bacterium]|jgi:branched-chain amino acid aminotransferase
MFAYINGEIVDEAVAGVALFDHGLTVGDGVFETIAVRRGAALASSRHLERLVRSALGMMLTPPGLPELHRAVGAAVAANPGIQRGALRVTYTSGPGTVGSARGGVAPTTIVTARELAPYPAVVDVATVGWPRNERGALAGLKTTSYAENVMALAVAQRHGAGEAIFANTAGRLCEGSGSNIFLAREGRLLTPPLSSGCLAGITRGLILERLADHAEERDMAMTALLEADEAFLTSALRDVQPIGRVDGRPLPAGPGPLTKAVALDYAALQAAEPDPPSRAPLGSGAP